MQGMAVIPTIATVALTAFCFISWILLLAGVGTFQTYLDDNGADEPGRVVSFQWWVVWFALPLIVGVGVAVFMKLPSVLIRPLALLFAVAFTKITMIIDITYKLREAVDDDYYYKLPDKLESGLNLMLAGGIMLSMGTLAMAVWLSVLDALTSPIGTAQSREAAAPGHAAAAPTGHAVPAANGIPAGGYNHGPGAPAAMEYAAPQDAVAIATAPGAPVIEGGPPKPAGTPLTGAPPPPPAPGAPPQPPAF